MPVTIDELQLKLSSDMGTAGSDIRTLEDSLNSLKGTLFHTVQTFFDASTSVKDFNTDLNNLRQSTAKGIDIKVNFEGVENKAQTMKRHLQTAFEASKADAKGLAKNLASLYNINDKGAVGNLEKSITSVFAAYRDGVDDSKAFDQAFNDINNTILKSGRVLSDYDDSLHKFYDQFKNKKIMLPNNWQSQVGTPNAAEWLRQNMGYLSNKGTVRWDTDIVEDNAFGQAMYSHLFKGTESDFKATVDRYVALMKEGAQKVKEGWKEFTSIPDTDENRLDIGENIIEELAKVEDAFKRNLENVSANDQGLFNLGAKIDVQKATAQLRADLQQIFANINAEKFTIPLNNVEIVFDPTQLKNSLTSIQTLIANFSKGNGIDVSAVSVKLDAIATALQTFRAGLTGAAPSKYVIDSIARAVRVFNNLAKIDTVKISVVIDSLVAALPKLSASLSVLSEMDSAPGIKAISSFASAIAKLGNADASKAINNARSVADAISEAIAKLNKSETVRADIGNFMKNIRQLSSGTGSLNVNMKNMANHTLPRLGNSMKKSSGSARSLLYTFYKIRGVVWAIRRLLGAFGKSIEYASDIVEVANVVRNTFREAEGQIAEFVDGSHQLLKDMWADQGWDTENIPGITERIGMNELAVSRMASRFQAMGSAMGFPNE